MTPKNKIVYVDNVTKKVELYNAAKQVEKFIRPLEMQLKLSADSLAKAHLKDTFGPSYNEAEQVWPRHFNIDLSERVQQNLVKKNNVKNFDKPLTFLEFENLD